MLLLTNDDGYLAPGIEALQRAVAALASSVIMAPVGPVSGCGHRVTTHATIRYTREGDDRIAVDGSPADCVRLALHHVVPGVDRVISGINAGGNLGIDVYHSGTVAAAREAAFHGVPGIAISHYIARGRSIDWSIAATRAGRVLEQLLSRPWDPGTFWNVNLPHLPADGPEPEIVDCPLDPSPLPLAYRPEEGGVVYEGNYHARPRRPGSDVDVCFGGQIAVTLVRLS